MAHGAQIYLVTPAFEERAGFARRLEAVLGAAPVAAVLIARSQGAGDGLQDYLADCRALIPVIQRHKAAALTLYGAVPEKGDGVHILEGFSDLREAVKKFQPQQIVGAGGAANRHEAMVKGECGPDYLLFGDPFERNLQPPAPMLDLAAWWAGLFEIPCVAMAGPSREGLQKAVATGAEFIGLNHFVWSHELGPEVAVKSAYEFLRQQPN